MNLLRALSVALFLVLLAFVISCTYVWTKEFVPVGEKKSAGVYSGWKLYMLNSNLKGWTLAIEVMAIKGIASKTVPSPPYDYLVKLKSTIKSAPDTNIVWDLVIDTLSVTFLSSGPKTHLTPSLYFWLSYASENELKKIFSFKVGGKEREPIIIPEGIDSLLIEFNAKLTPGELSTTTHSFPDILYDSVRVEDYSLTEVVPVKFKMVRHDTKRKHPSFLVDH